MEYQVIYDCGTNETKVFGRLENAIKELIAQGWKPLGGVSITRFALLQIDVAQAMIREKVEES